MALNPVVEILKPYLVCFVVFFIFPRKCLGCNKSGTYICQNCIKKDISRTKTSFNNIKLHSPFSYRGNIRKAIISFKYYFAYDLARDISKHLVAEIKKAGLFKSKKIILIPIPLHQKREFWRGFNQTEEIGKLVCKSLNWEYQDKLLIRKKHSRQQTGLKEKQRIKNIKGAFSLNQDIKLDKRRTYIVFDDVWTTGSTIKEACKILKKAGIKKVQALVICR